VALVRTDVSEKRIASIIRVEGISEVGTMLKVISNFHPFHLDDGGDTFLRNVGSYKSHTQCHIPEEDLVQQKSRKLRPNIKALSGTGPHSSGDRLCARPRGRCDQLHPL
jgi:hypothetical protein